MCACAETCSGRFGGRLPFQSMRSQRSWVLKWQMTICHISSICFYAILMMSRSEHFNILGNFWRLYPMGGGNSMQLISPSYIRMPRIIGDCVKYLERNCMNCAAWLMLQHCRQLSPLFVSVWVETQWLWSEIPFRMRFARLLECSGR
eukprot:Lithocolla_globosa_v1_NODE_1938_length_2250_cov_16.232802.p2 type:complete len:147 gc:universal NODE_1938_length_2250_cov_16.232802:1003-563(-)